MNPLQLKRICDRASRNLVWRDGSHAINVGAIGLSKFIDVDRLASLAEAVQREGAVVVSFASQEYLELAFEWAKAIRRCNVSNYLVVCGDAPTHDVLEARGIPVIRAHIDTGGMPDDFRSQNNYSARGLAMMALKLPAVDAILSRGLNVVLSDIDALWRHDPFPFLSDDVDLAFQRVVYLPPAVVECWGFSLCNGFVYFRSSPATRTFLQDCLRWHAEVVSEQVATNLAFICSDMKWDFPEGYDREYPLVQEKAKAQFIALAGNSFRGVSAVSGLRALALPADRFWRHPFVAPRDMVICHPNSSRVAEEKLETLNHWMALAEQAG